MSRKSSQSSSEKQLAILQSEIVECALCPRLVEWRRKVSIEKVKRFQDQEYWGKPLPSFGREGARLFIIGLAPAAHGGNRTGRMFTGDRSGDWLYRALHRAGFANQYESVNRNDGLELIDAYITAVIHCAPPDNKPLPEEIKNCRPYLLREIDALKEIRVVVALGHLAFDTALSLFQSEFLQQKSNASPFPSKKVKAIRQAKPRFSHGAEASLHNGITLIASYHPSQQNTFTGRLTEEMLDEVFNRARFLINQSTGESEKEKSRA